MPDLLYNNLSHKVWHLQSSWPGKLVCHGHQAVKPISPYQASRVAKEHDSNDACEHSGLATYQRILARFAQLPPSQQPAPTFLEIAGYPHLENVASNILRFFLEPQGEHNLKGLVLESLLLLLNAPTPITSFAEVRREVTTQRGNRIDLVIESETCIVGIENKIYHGVHNDLADYWTYLVTQSRGRTPYGVLLSLHVPPSTVPLHNFHVITYKQLLNHIDARLGEANDLTLEPYTVFLSDWMQTMRRLTELTALNAQMLALFREHQDGMNGLLREAALLKSEMRGTVKALADLLTPDAQAVPGLIGFNLWRDERLVDVLYYDFDGGDSLVVATDIIVEPTGWRIDIHNRRGSVEQLERWLTTRSITTKIRHGREFRLTYGDPGLPYLTELTVVKEFAAELLSKIRG